MEHNLHRDLTEKDLATLKFIHNFQTTNGYSPTLNQIKHAINTKSTRGVKLHLDKLNKLGYIERSSGSRRAIKIINPPVDSTEETIIAPIVGEIKAGFGANFFSEEIEKKEISISLTGGRRNVILLKIRGNSMTEAGFNPGDLAIVVAQSEAKDGDIVIALDPEDGSETIKRFKKFKNYVALLPESNDPINQPRIGTNFQIQGKVIGKVSA